MTEQQPQLPVKDVSFGDLVQAWLEKQGMDFEDSDTHIEYIYESEVLLTRGTRESFKFNPNNGFLNVTVDYEVMRERK